MVVSWKNALFGAVAIGTAAAVDLNIGSGGQTIHNLKREVSLRFVLGTEELSIDDVLIRFFP